MRELRDNEKVREAKLTIENKDGLKLETERVRQTVEYTLEGGGNIRARTKRKKRYNSKDKTKKITIEEATDKNFIGESRQLSRGCSVQHDPTYFMVHPDMRARRRSDLCGCPAFALS
jgi:hypothetical protein